MDIKQGNIYQREVERNNRLQQESLNHTNAIVAKIIATESFENVIPSDVDIVVNWAALKGCLDVIKLLEARGAHLHSNSSASLCIASKTGHLEVVKYLVDRGADISTWNYIPLLYAVTYNHVEIAKYLVDKGAPVNILSDRCLKYVVFCKKHEEIRRVRAQKKIYFWWVEISKRQSGKG